MLLNISQMSKTMRKKIKKHEKYYNRVCRRMWEHENPKGERIIYGCFCRNYNRLILAVGYYYKNIRLTIS